MAEDAIRCYVEGLQKHRQSIPQEGEVGSFRLSVSM